MNETNKIDNSDVPKGNMASVTPQQVKKLVEGPIRGGLMKRTLKELQTLGIQLKNIFTMREVTINLSWDQVIKLVNYNAGKKVLGWEDTFEDAVETIGIFLV